MVSNIFLFSLIGIFTASFLLCFFGVICGLLFFFLFCMFLVSILLYFYNLTNDRNNLTRNMLLRIVVVGFAPMLYGLFGKMNSGDKIVVIFAFFIVPILFFCLMCRIIGCQISTNKYFHHLCWICLYWLGIFLIYIFLKDRMDYIAFQKAWGYLFFLPSILFCGLVLCGVIGLLLYRKFWLTKHDVICLLSCIALTIITETRLPFIGVFFKPFGILLPEFINFLLYALSICFALTLIFILLFYYSSYFLKLFFSWRNINSDQER